MYYSPFYIQWGSLSFLWPKAVESLVNIRGMCMLHICQYSHHL